MAIDTENERRSTICVLPVPSGSVTARNRVQATWTYIGLWPIDEPVDEWLMPLFASYRDYNFNAPQHFTISSNKVQMTARYRDYNFNAPRRGSMATAKDVWLEGTPAVVVEGATPTVTVTFRWATAVSGTTTNEIYKDGSSTDTAATYLSGSTSVSGNTTTCKAFQALVPGNYVLVINATVDGVLDVWKMGLVVEKQEDLW